MLCSILIPSCRRFNRLKEALKSWYNTASMENFEVIVRLTEDEESVRRQAELLSFGGNIRVFLQPEKPPNIGTTTLWNFLSPHATGDWCAYSSDDITIHGKWDDQLSQLPLSGVVAHAETHQLNATCYKHDGMSPVPFVPRGAIASLGHKTLCEPFDRFLYDLLVQKNNWQLSFLKGVRVWHQRAADSTLAQA